MSEVYITLRTAPFSAGGWLGRRLRKGAAGACSKCTMRSYAHVNRILSVSECSIAEEIRTTRPLLIFMIIDKCL
ncbi:hypothetical protein KIN20_024697 [Parelaphostrongylus tenuis]|uniref:Uncharacterized protein n=1 Tax=Parelaphostrongylus tenuis TaxID=148309 RepID=A0AAD5MTV3_PARTN|nr:hypothetical protein KIN20_024697 [Parelaphostrongylus tenuis]